MKILLQSTAFTALAALLFLGCGRADRETADSFASTLKGDVLEQYERLSQEADLDLEAMAMFLGTEMVTEWLGVLSRPVSERLASTLKGDDLQRYESLSRLERDTFELIALIERELAMEWLSVGPGPQGQEGEGIGQDYTGPRTPAKAFAPDIAQSTQLPLAPIIETEALVQYARLMSVGRADFEFFVRGVGLEEAEESLLAFTAGWNSRFHIPSSAFIAPLPPLKNALSADETAKLRALDSRIRDPFVENWEYGLKIHAPDPSDPTAALAFTDPAAFVAEKTEEYEGQLKKVLMALPVKLPPIEEIASSEAVAQYQRLHPDLKEEFWNDVGGIYARGITVGRGNFPPLTDSQIKDYFSTIVASMSHTQAQ